MAELLSVGILPVVVTLIAFRLGQLLQQKFKTPLLNPILTAMLLVLGFLFLTGMDIGTYQTGMKNISWLMTPATVCLAIPMYAQFQALRKNLKAIAAGIAAGTVSCLIMVFCLCAVLQFDRSLTVSLLPKSITSAIGVVLSEMGGGMPSLTTASIVLTGIFASILGTGFCRLFRITHPVAQGVAFGTAGHVIATARANELSPLIGAVSSLSLVVAGLLTAVIFPFVLTFL